jgi:hypothetical protein
MPKPFTIIKNKKELAAYVANLPEVIDSRVAYEENAPGSFDEVMEELIRLLASEEGSPDFGEDWGPWISLNISEMLEEAISIVM